MKDHLKPFLFNEEQLVRIETDQYGEPWFIAKDVCSILNIKQAVRAVENLDDDEKGVTSTHTLGGIQELLTINESGLYVLIFRSRKEEAKAFRKWVTSEVLPSIRKTGKYSIEPEVLEDETEITESLKVRKVSEARQTFGPQAAGQLWMKLGLPMVPAMLNPKQGDFFRYEDIKTIETNLSS
jgi:prophage antirepressor-like protein